MLRRLAATAAGSAGLGMLLGAYQIAPFLGGTHASWASGNVLFDPQQSFDHTLTAHQTIAGLAQETAGVFTGSAADLLHFTWRKWKCAATAALCFTRHFPAIGGTPPPSDGLGQQSRRIGF